MKKFLNEDFLLNNKTAVKLYHDFAKGMPIIDYHCHLSPQPIADDQNFNNITEVWLNGDHYKWRAMRTNGVDEYYITGDASPKEKFKKWAETVPYTLRNPLYHWTHLELQRYFDIDTILNGETADKIYDQCSEMLKAPEFSVRSLLKKMNVYTVCTTDDPLDSLEFHQQIKNSEFTIPILPAFRPDAAMNAGNDDALTAYIEKLSAVTDTDITNYNQYLDALRSRHNYFSDNGCSVSDHGLEEMYATSYTDNEISKIFERILKRETLKHIEELQFKSAMLAQFAEWDHEKNWVQQYHLGAIRNNNKRMYDKLGADTGWDSIGSFDQAKPLSAFLNRMDANNNLAKTIIYNLNPADNEVMATMLGNFNDGSVAGKIQFGSAWWFLDQKDGMTKQLNALSNMGLLSKFVGMLTDSRSFLSYPRHEYFRRLLCNLFGEEMENGELPDDMEWTGKIIQDICFNNAKEYFGW